MKINASFLEKTTGNNYPENYDYITITTYGEDAIGAPRVIFEAERYYISQELPVTNALHIAPGAVLMMAEDTYLYTDDSVMINGTSEAPVEIKGFEGATWQGLSLLSWQVVDIQHLIITDAGAGNFDSKYFDSEVPAAIHVQAKVNIENSHIVNSHGYGISFDRDGEHANWEAPNTYIANNSIQSELPAMVMDYTRVDRNYRSEWNNTFSVPEGVAAIELVPYKAYRDNLQSHEWHALPEGNFYLVNTDVELFPFALTIKPGVVLKFKAGKSLYTPTHPADSYFPGLNLFAIGTAEQPIIFDSEAGTPGTWGGISLDQMFDLRHCEIRNGGEMLTPGATEKANFVLRPLVGLGLYDFKNNMVTGSAGFGVLVEQNAIYKDFDAVESGNSYSNNTSGDIEWKH